MRSYEIYTIPTVAKTIQSRLKSSHTQNTSPIIIIPHNIVSKTSFEQFVVFGSYFCKLLPARAMTGGASLRYYSSYYDGYQSIFKSACLYGGIIQRRAEYRRLCLCDPRVLACSPVRHTCPGDQRGRPPTHAALAWKLLVFPLVSQSAAVVLEIAGRRRPLRRRRSHGRPR